MVISSEDIEGGNNKSMTQADADLPNQFRKSQEIIANYNSLNFNEREDDDENERLSDDDGDKINDSAFLDIFE